MIENDLIPDGPIPQALVVLLLWLEDYFAAKRGGLDAITTEDKTNY